LLSKKNHKLASELLIGLLEVTLLSSETLLWCYTTPYLRPNSNGTTKYELQFNSFA